MNILQKIRKFFNVEDEKYPIRKATEEEIKAWEKHYGVLEV